MTEDFFASLSGLDYVVLGVVVLLVILGFRRGFSGELGRLAGVLASAATLFFGYKPIAAWVDGLHVFQNSVLATKLLVLICLLVLCISVWLLVKKLLSDAVKTILKQPFDAILGGVIGGLKAVLALSLICTFGVLSPTSAFSSKLQESSAFVMRLADLIRPWIPLAEAARPDSATPNSPAPHDPAP